MYRQDVLTSHTQHAPHHVAQKRFPFTHTAFATPCRASRSPKTKAQRDKSQCVRFIDPQRQLNIHTHSTRDSCGAHMKPHGTIKQAPYRREKSHTTSQREHKIHTAVKPHVRRAQTPTHGRYRDHPLMKKRTTNIQRRTSESELKIVVETDRREGNVLDLTAFLLSL